MSTPQEKTGFGAPTRVALGILVSRVLGLAREAVFASFFGLGGHADVLAAVFRAPNILQNLLGEQSLSASFIPVYSRMLAEGRPRQAGRFAGAIFGLLLATAALMSLLGIFFADEIVAFFAPGFLQDASRVAQGLAEVDRFALASRAIRFTFPMAGLLVLAAWCLGVLNSHRRFFLAYVAPAAWNLAIISALFAAAFWLLPATGVEALGALASSSLRDRLLLATCAGALLGGLLQFAVQLPLVSRLMQGFRLSLSTRVEGVREALRAFLPLLTARGALQIAFYLQQVLASLLATGAVAGLRWAGALHALPVSLFAMSVSAAELPELASRSAGGREEEVSNRARRGLRQIAFLILPTTVGYLVFGFLIVGGIFRWGRFTSLDNWLVYLVLASYALGLPASTWSRLLVNVFYARGQTRTPARIAIVQLTVAIGVGAALMLWLDRFSVNSLVGSEAEHRIYLGSVGLGLASSAAAWLELGLLRRALGRLLPAFALPWRFGLGALTRASVAAVPAAGVALLLGPLPTTLRALAVVLSYAAVYLGLSRRTAAAELESWLGRVGRRLGRARGDD